MDWHPRKEKEPPNLADLLSPRVTWGEVAVYAGVVALSVPVVMIGTRIVSHLLHTEPGTAARQALITHGIAVQPISHGAANTLATGCLVALILAAAYVRLYIRERRRGA